MDNMNLWNSVKTTDPSAVKPITGTDMTLLARSVLHYDPKSGVFTWLIDAAPNAPAGSVAGYQQNRGYWLISILYQSYLAHRLAWLMTHGDWPPGQIDHINGDRIDNRLCNLRAVSNAQNAQNKRRARSDNKAGALGVRAVGNSWQARITTSGKTSYLGCYSSLELASAAYLGAKRAMHEMGTL